ncbi:MAG: TolC family protein [Rhodothermus sp.]|nr:TolC family protein [Rhodothermus sp.]
MKYRSSCRMLHGLPGLFLCTVLVLPLQAQPVRLTLAEAIARGLQTHPDLATAEAAVAAAQARIGQARAALQPRLQFSISYQRLSEITPFVITMPLPDTEPIEITPNIPNQYRVQLLLQQPLFQGGRLRAQLQAARQEAAATAAERNVRREALAYRIATAYWQHVEAEALARAADENVRRLEAHLTDARNRQAQGLLLESEVLDVEVALEQARLEALRRRHAVQLTAVVLNSLVGLPPNTPLRLTDRPDTTRRPVPSLDSLWALALQKRPELAALRHTIARAEALRSMAQASRWPQVALVGRYLYARPNPRIIPLQDRFEGTWEIGLSLTFDLWNGLRTHHQMAEATALRRQAEAREASTLRALNVALTQAQLSVEQAYEQLRLARLVVQQAKARYALVRNQFAQGLRTSRDLLDAETALAQARTREIQAQIACALAWLTLQQATGTLTETLR